MMEDNSHKIILDLCGGTGSWSRPYLEAGYDVRLITLPDNDVRDFRDELYDSNEDFLVYGVLAAPPCTHFSLSGAQYWKQKDADGRTGEALEIVYACLKIIELINPFFWCLENPVGRLKDFIGKPDMYFNPCDYGDQYTKKTCLWGKFKPPLKNPVVPIRSCKQGSWIMKLGGNSDRTKELRSITPPGFASAFFRANQ